MGLGETLNQEIRQNEIEGVHVCTVLPTAHDTPFFDHAANYTGQALEAPEPLFDPRNVVEAIVRLAIDPLDPRIVANDGAVTIPNLSLADKAPARPPSKRPGSPTDSPGAVRAPVLEGTGVSAGRR